MDKFIIHWSPNIALYIKYYWINILEEYLDHDIYIHYKGPINIDKYIMWNILSYNDIWYTFIIKTNKKRILVYCKGTYILCPKTHRDKLCIITSNITYIDIKDIESIIIYAARSKYNNNNSCWIN